MNAEEIARKLGKAYKSGDGWQCRCPAHDDNSPSLVLSDGAGGKLLWSCKGGCKQEAVGDALRAKGLLNGSSASQMHIGATYDYVDEAGKLVFQVVRILPKNFRQRRPDGAGGWIWNIKGVVPVPYKLPRVIEAIKAGKTIYIVEGEKDANRLERLGLVATTNAGGAGKWTAAHSKWMKGADVVILPDNDRAGADHAVLVAKSLAGIAKRVRTCNLPGLPEKGDVSDFLGEDASADVLLTAVEESAAEPERKADSPVTPAGSFGTRTAREIMGADARAIIECVPGRVPAGLVVIGGRPKARKSWWALQLDIAKARGNGFMGRPCEACRVLGIYLEDNDRRMARRLAFFGIAPETAPENLHLTYTWAHGVEGVEQLDRWMQQYPDTKKVTIDVLQRFRGPKDPKVSIYEADYYIMGLLHGLTVKYPGLTILVVHHVRKGDVDDPVEALNGSFAIAGAADAYVILRRHDKESWIAHIDGRDWEPWEHDFVWEFRQDEGWAQLGTYEEAGLNDRQAEILAMAKQAGVVTPSALAERYDISRPAAHEALRALVTKGALYNKSGKYYPTVVTVP